MSTPNGRAVMRALDAFPHSSTTVSWKSKVVPARAKRPDVNLGVAIDLTKKDGTRTLLVPNIRKANQLTFSELKPTTT